MKTEKAVFDTQALKARLKELKNDNLLIAGFMQHNVRTKTDGTTNMAYDKYWDCLMPVVEKIRALAFNEPEIKVQANLSNQIQYIEAYTNIFKSFQEVSITITHNTVVKFIRWYNENKTRLKI